MTGFSADWLALRTAADGRARNAGLAARLGAHFGGRSSLRVLDLGAGTGANLRATAPLIPCPQHWLLADHDPALLAWCRPVPGTEIETRSADLSGDLTALFDPVPDLVTCSAFLDLCGAAWLDRLAEALARSGAALFAVLSYDGREVWEPPHALDAPVLAAFDADQRRDKGLGASLGPDAHAYLARSLHSRGYQVLEGRSDWVLEQSRDAGLIAALAQGSAGAVAGAMGTGTAETWRAARESALRVTIGHRDLLAFPPG
jgi:SAM-dependent methyltransferase